MTLTELSISHFRHNVTLASHVKLRRAEFAYKVDSFEMFTIYKMTFCLKFLSLTVKIGQNKNKIGNIKVIRNLLTKLESYLKRYLKRK